MTLDKNIITVFFSWQSTLDNKTNTNYIRNALEKAKSKIENTNSNIEIKLDEATRDVPGSPDIVKTIQNKISLSQIVISDITIIEGLDKKKSYPNPNVIFELGYAVAEIGWDRIIALTNDKYGYNPEHLPFDINKHRVARYNSDNEKNKLINLLVDAITIIISRNPKTPQELRGVTPEKVMHEKDVGRISQLMSYMHTYTIETFLSDLPNIMNYDASICWESFDSLMKSNAFYIYDESILNLLNSLHHDWHQLLSCGIPYYENSDNSVNQIFKKARRYDSLNGKAAMEAWDEIQALANKMKSTFRDLLDKIHKNYIEIDIDDTNAKAWQDIITYRPQMKQS